MSDQQMQGQESQSAPLEPQRLQDFKTMLPESLSSDPALEPIKDLESLTKSFISSQRMLGNSLRIPTKEADAAQWDSFYSKLESVPGVARLPNPEDKAAIKTFMHRFGVPEEAQKYDLHFDDRVQKAVDKGLVDEYKQLAYDLNIPADSADKLAQWQVNKVLEQEKAFLARNSETEQTLHKLWGQGYDTNIAYAQSALRSYHEQFPGAAKELDQLAYYNPAVMVMLANQGMSKIEGQHAGSSGNPPTFSGMTPEEAKQRINELRTSKQYMEAKANPLLPSSKEVFDRLEYYYSIPGVVQR